MTAIPFKQWRHQEAQKYGVSEAAIFDRVKRGKYPGLKLRRENARVVWVLASGAPLTVTATTRHGFCECGNPATVKCVSVNRWICKRCHDLESRTWDLGRPSGGSALHPFNREYDSRYLTPYRLAVDLHL